jgi:hypothetical protein
MILLVHEPDSKRDAGFKKEIWNQNTIEKAVEFCVSEVITFDAVSGVVKVTSLWLNIIPWRYGSMYS